MASIVAEGLGKIYEDGTRAVGDVNLNIATGEFLVLVGPSGCGKSTILRMIAGLEDITEGTLSIGDRVVNDVQPKDRDIAMVFQNYALYPHMTVYENMAFGLKLRKTPKDEVKRRVHDAADVLEIGPLLDRKPKTLSGGQRQRVAMGRAIVREPQAFLMDEPLSNLDAKLRVQMRSELGQLHNRLGTTTVYVTHDQVEAMTLGSRVAVLKPVSEDSPNNLQQVDEPSELFNNPVNLFVASFIGSPAMNLAYCTLEGSGGEVHVNFAGNRLRVDPVALSRHPELQNRMGDKLVVGMRPGDFEAASAATPNETIPAKVDVAEMLGSETFIHYTVDAPPVLTDALDVLREDEGEVVETGATTTSFTARIRPDVRANIGDVINLNVDTKKLHFFDPATGRRIG